jgi:hypothetical protein
MKRKLLTIGLPILGVALVAGIGIALAQTTTTNTATTGMQMDGGGPGGSGGQGGPGGGFDGGFNSISPADYATNQATEFQDEANALGLSVSVVTDGWANGENLQQIATANGISTSTLQTDLSTYRTAQLTAQLQALVTNGTITQAQMATRLASEQAQATQMQNGAGNGFRGPPPGAATSTPPAVQ